VENLTPQLGEYFGVKNGQGVLVRSVEKGSKAESAGFKAGDVIMRVGSDSVADTADWNRLMRENAGQTVSIAVMRERRERNLKLAVAEPPKGGGEANLNLVLPSLHEELEDLREEIRHELKAAMSPQNMEQLRNWQRTQAEAMEKELKRIGPQLERAIREAQAEVQEAIRQAR
jgi:hypothetical protein